MFGSLRAVFVSRSLTFWTMFYQISVELPYILQEQGTEHMWQVFHIFTTDCCFPPTWNCRTTLFNSQKQMVFIYFWHLYDHCSIGVPHSLIHLFIRPADAQLSAAQWGFIKFQELNALLPVPLTYIISKLKYASLASGHVKY